MISLDSIKEKTRQGIRLTIDDALFLFRSYDVIALGELASTVNEKKNKDIVFYNLNRHINPTNICVMSCKFCAFAKKPKDDGSYAYSIEEILAKATLAVQEGATEVHMVGGLHPRWNLNYYLEMLATIKKQFPGLHIKGFTAVELDWLAKKTRISVKEVIAKLHEAGLDSLPGGGAEIFAPKIRDKITAKLSTDSWLDIHRTAHKMGINSNCTMLYGHIESFADRVYHLNKLRELQDETRGFNAFIPLSFQPHNNDMNIDRYTFGIDDLKTIAVARLFLDNFYHIKSYWVMSGQDIAQLATSFGANDIDGTIVEEKISHAAGGRSGISLSKNKLITLLRKANKIPVERDSLYNNISNTKFSETPVNKYNDFEKPPRATDTLEDIVGWSKNTSLHQLASQSQKVIQDNQLNDKKSFSLGLKVDFSKCLTISSTIQKIKIKLDEHNVLKQKTIIKIDLSSYDSFSYKHTKSHLINLCKSIQQSFPHTDLVVSSIERFYHLAKTQTKTLHETLKELKKVGLKTIEDSCQYCDELEFDQQLDFHKYFHKQNIPTVARIQFEPSSLENFISHLRSLYNLQEKTRGLIGLFLQTDPKSMITIYEYMQAIAVSRILSTNIPNIICPILSIPSVSDSQTQNMKTFLPQEKTFPLCLLMGANDLGHIYIDQINKKMLNIILENIQSTKQKPYIRDSRFNYYEVS